MATQIVITESELDKVIAHKREMARIVTLPSLKESYEAEYLAYLGLRWEFFTKPTLNDNN